VSGVGWSAKGTCVCQGVMCLDGQPRGMCILVVAFDESKW